MDFLKSFEGTVFQVFRDNPKAIGFPQVFETFDEQRFKVLNDGGCGIYFTPNACKGGRKEENLVRINAVYADIDVAKEGDNMAVESIKEKKEFIIDKLEYTYAPPNFIIDTKNGLQAIWLVLEEELTTESKKKFKTIIEGIIHFTEGVGSKGDQVKDLTRVLRLPGFYHMKGDPYLCTSRELHLDRFKMDDLLEIFPLPKVEEQKPELPKSPFKPFQKPYQKGLVDQSIDNLDTQELAIRAFYSVGREASFDRQGRVILDGRLTGTFQGKNGDRKYLASTSHEPIKGNHTTMVASILNMTNSEARRWIMDQYGLNEKKLQVEKSLSENIEVVEKPMRKYYSWGTEALTNNFGPIKRDTYAIVGAGSGTGKTTFCLNMAFKNAELGHKVLYVSLEMTQKDLFEHLARKASSQTIWEEIHNETPEDKMERYKKRLDELGNKQNLTIRGISGQLNITFEYLEKLMEGDWDLIFVDNFNLIVRDAGKNQYDHEGELSSKFVAYAKEKQTPLVVVHHYSKGGQREIVKTSYSLSGNAKIINDAHRIVLLERKYFEEDDEPTPKDRARMKVTLDKCRGYDSGVRRVIYFYRGEFFDEYPEDEKPQVQSDLFN